MVIQPKTIAAIAQPNPGSFDLVTNRPAQNAKLPKAIIATIAMSIAVTEKVIGKHINPTVNTPRQPQIKAAIESPLSRLPYPRNKGCVNETQ